MRSRLGTLTGLALTSALAAGTLGASPGASAPAAAPGTTAGAGAALAAAPGFDADAAPLTAEQFRRPSNHFKPAVRWWWAGPVSVQESVREITAIADAGFGEVEIAFTTDVWANDAQRENLRAVMDKADELDVKVSMTMGAGWPVRTPDTGLGSGLAQQELQYGRVDVGGGQVYRGAPPVAFDAEMATDRPADLVAVTVAKVLEEGPAAELLPAAQRPRWGTPVRVPETSTILDPDSLEDITDSVGADGSVEWRAPDDGDYILFAFWRRDAGPYASFFDPEAARTVGDYIAENQIGAENEEALRKVGGDFFEDSLELNANSLFWAPTFEEEFEKRRGYDMAAHLPLMYAHGMSRYWVPTEEPTPDFELPDDEGSKIRQDYYRLLTDLYVDDHLAIYQEWSRTLGLDHKAQVAYGQNLEPIRSNREFARMGGSLEGESYNSGDRFPTDITNYGWRFALDHQRTLAGGAHQGGQTRLSTEMGAQPQNSHQINLGDYQAMMDKEWAAGYTQPFLHGYQYMSIGAPWPGKYRFGDTSHDSFNDVNNPQWPLFEHQNAYYARGTQVLETGTPRTDVAIYRDGFLTTAARTAADEGTQPERLFDTLAMERTGYSVQYIDPVGLAEDGVIGRDGTLYSDGPAYRSLVVDERAMPADAAEAVAQAAAAGVKVVLVGALPARDATYGSGAEGDRRVRAAMSRAIASPNVARATTQADVARALDRLGAAPRVDWEGAHVLTQLRDTDGVRTAYLYNPTNAPVSFTPRFEGEGVPQRMDLQDGTITPFAQYSVADGRTAVPLTLRPQEAVVVAVDSRIADRPVHVVGGTQDDDLHVEDGRIVLRTTEDGERTFRLSNGQTRTVVARTPDEAANEGPYIWGLSVEAFTPQGTRTIEIPTLSGTFPLWDWRDRAPIAGESGVGTYRTTFTLDDDWAGDGKGVMLGLGRVQGTAEIRINGRAVGAQTVHGDRWDVTSFLQPGVNQVEVDVRTTMRNAVTKYNGTSTRTSAYGLRGPVRFDPYAEVVVWDPAVEPAAPTITTAPSVRGSHGGTLVVTATVSAVGEAATGTVALWDGRRELASAELADGRVRLTVPRGTLAAGWHRLRLAYEGSDGVEPGEAAVSARISKATAQIGVQVSQQLRSTQQGTMRVTARPFGLPGEGRVQVRRANGSVVGTASVDRAGRATFRLPRLSAGTHRMRIVYGGTADIARAERVVTVTVRR